MARNTAIGHAPIAAASGAKRRNDVNGPITMERRLLEASTETNSHQRGPIFYHEWK
jgi:hypothetical protein